MSSAFAKLPVIGIKILPWILAAFFLLGALGNIFAPTSILEDYRRWGYPSWFHYITGSLELLVMVLLLRQATRKIGAAIAVLVMTAAAGTVLLHGETMHAIPPLIVLVFAALLYRLTPRS